MTKLPLIREWDRTRTSVGNLVYWTGVSEYMIVNVFRGGSLWRWMIVGFTDITEDRPIILKHGTAGTKHEACWWAERNIPENAPAQKALPW